MASIEPSSAKQCVVTPLRLDLQILWVKRELIPVRLPEGLEGSFVDLTDEPDGTAEEVVTRDEELSCEKPAEAESDASSVSSPNKGKKKLEKS